MQRLQTFFFIFVAFLRFLTFFKIYIFNVFTPMVPTSPVPRKLGRIGMKWLFRAEILRDDRIKLVVDH